MVPSLVIAHLGTLPMVLDIGPSVLDTRNKVRHRRTGPTTLEDSESSFNQLRIKQLPWFQKVHV
jgi:hypothetical protein